MTIGAEVLLRDFLDSLKGKRVAMVANHSTRLPNRGHLVDELLERGVQVVKVFAPEHGFRGDADAGEKIANSVDPKTGLPLVSLYGDNKKPTPAQLAGVDVVIFDIQDVGVRFYTYLSTMAYVQEACAAQKIPFWILDRPNPNGWYVDGPVLEKAYSSFIGLHEIPIVHGMTLGEYAGMINEEGWLAGGVKANVKVIPCEGYRHTMRWEETGLDWIPPSPNLATPLAATLYPAICWFEPTPISVGRGTDSAFTIIGAPWLTFSETVRMDTDGSLDMHGYQVIPVEFTPRSLPGKASNPPYQDQAIPGFRILGNGGGKELMLVGVQLFELSYQSAPASAKASFFKKNFERWPGTADFRRQIETNESPVSIYESWQPAVQKFAEVRARYLMYE